MELLTDSQVHAIKHDLSRALFTFESQAQAIKSSKFSKNFSNYSINYHFTGGQRVVLDLDDWETSDDEKGDGDAPRACFIPSDPKTSVSQQS